MHIFHDWTRWVTFRTGIYSWQFRECKKCGIRKERVVH